ncbi:BAR domain protein [Elsinoe ampelina]|uniref:BAR domain protein n=1 Tax=Elsinoe ampelina TaxID=302913 RepID=A0A6A6GDK2_9PEZI|nr:BAR domain protein [Elsinoe ampelina]
MNNFTSFGKNLGASITPFAQRTQQYVKEQLGQADEKTELPPDYLALERRVDALKAVHTKLLAATSQYSNESYDYPPNIRESFTDLSRTVGDKVKLLSSASSAAEAQAAFTAPPSSKPAPKTFNHAIARASLGGSRAVVEADLGVESAGSATGTSGGAGGDALSTALEKYAVAQEKVGEARLYQDTQIASRFLSPWQTTLNTSIGYAAKARRAVGDARLNLDAVKSRARTRFGSESSYDEKTRTEIEKAEDEFVAKVEEASGIMKNCLDTPEPLRNLVELVRAQREFHENAAKVLAEVEDEVEKAQNEQEDAYRKSRDGA